MSTFLDFKARYRGLLDVQLEGLSRINLIVGANNSGKSSLLEALYLACDPVNPERWFEVARGREVKASREPLFESIQWLFPRQATGTESEIHMTFERAGTPPGRHVYGQMVKRLEVGGAESGQDTEPEDVLVLTAGIEPTPGSPPDHPLRQRGEFRIPSRGREAILPARTREAIPCVFVSPVTHRTELFQVKALSSVFDEPSAKEDVARLLQSFDPGVQDIFLSDRSGMRSGVRVWHSATGSTPITAFGDGFRRVLTYALALYECRGGVLLIDEIETALHFSALQWVYAWLAEAADKHKVQMIATTHSLEAMDAILASVAPGEPQQVEADSEFEPTEIPPHGVENLRVYRLRETADGVVVRTLTGASAWDLRYRGGLELR